jgi:hypothetical protein
LRGRSRSFHRRYSGSILTSRCGRSILCLRRKIILLDWRRSVLWSRLRSRLCPELSCRGSCWRRRSRRRGWLRCPRGRRCKIRRRRSRWRSNRWCLTLSWRERCRGHWRRRDWRRLDSLRGFCRCWGGTGWWSLESGGGCGTRSCERRRGFYQRCNWGANSDRIREHRWVIPVLSGLLGRGRW